MTTNDTTVAPYTLTDGLNEAAGIAAANDDPAQGLVTVLLTTGKWITGWVSFADVATVSMTLAERGETHTVRGVSHTDLEEGDLPLHVATSHVIAWRYADTDDVSR